VSHFSWFREILEALETLEFKGGFEVWGEVFLLAEFLINGGDELVELSVNYFIVS